MEQGLSIEIVQESTLRLNKFPLTRLSKRVVDFQDMNQSKLPDFSDDR
jgi:hypothetical protein